MSPLDEQDDDIIYNKYASTEHKRIPVYDEDSKTWMKMKVCLQTTHLKIQRKSLRRYSEFEGSGEKGAEPLSLQTCFSLFRETENVRSTDDFP